MDILLPLYTIAVFLLINYVLDCIEEAIHFHDWRDEE